MALVLAGSRAAACLPPLAAHQQQAAPQHARCQPFVAGPWGAAGRRRLQRLRAEEERGTAGATQTGALLLCMGCRPVDAHRSAADSTSVWTPAPPALPQHWRTLPPCALRQALLPATPAFHPPAEEPEVRVNMDIDKEVSKFARNAATTFAPRASGATGKNPAYKGSVLYTIFEVGAGGRMGGGVLWCGSWWAVCAAGGRAGRRVGKKLTQISVSAQAAAGLVLSSQPLLLHNERRSRHGRRWLWAASCPSTCCCPRTTPTLHA